MVWLKFSKNALRKKRLRSLKSQQYNLFSKLQTKNSFYFSWNFYIPLNWNFLILKKSLFLRTYYIFFLFTQQYYFKFSSPFTPYLKIYSSLTQIISCRFYTYPKILPLFTLILQKLISFFTLPFFLKIRFKGKGYYVFKNKRNTTTPQFGLAHRRLFYASTFIVKFLSKTMILLFGLTSKDIFTFSYSFKETKSINIFTGRGVRFARQIIYKKVGKVSTYR